VVLVSLGLSRLRRLGLCRTAAALAATAAARSHVLAAIHPAVAVAVRTAVPPRRVTLVLTRLAAMLLARRHLVPGMARLTSRRDIAVLLVLRMGLVRLCRRRRLSGDRHGERKRDRTDKYLHLKCLLSRSKTKVRFEAQATRGGGSADSGWSPRTRPTSGSGRAIAGAIGWSAMMLPSAGMAEHATAQSVRQSPDFEPPSSSWLSPAISAQCADGLAACSWWEAASATAGMAMAACPLIMLSGARSSASMVRIRTRRLATMARR
jgi:hypothetical protein